MPTTSLMPTPKQQYFAFAGIPLVGGQVFTYAAGTTNPKATYSDSAGTVPQANPIILNARGEPANAIFWSGAYKVVVQDALGNIIYTVDNYNTDPLGTGNILPALAAPGGATLVGHSVRSIYSVADLVGSIGREHGDTAQLISYYTGWSALLGAPVGGSPLTWHATMPRSSHDGGMIFSPTVPFSGNVVNINNYLSGVGETAPGALGCWVRSLPDGVVYVTYYGAVPGGAQDMTVPFNAATQSTVPYGAVFNDSTVKRVIGVPTTGVAFRIEGTVYVRKGQHLKGVGDGPARIFIPVVASAAPTFKLGFGFIGGVVTEDLGGLPPSVSDLATEGGHTGAGVFDCAGIAGVNLFNLFVTTAPSGITGLGGDVTISHCVFDDGATHITISGTSSRNIITGCSFFHPTAYAVLVTGAAYDLLINGNLFAYAQINDILIQGTANQVRGISITDNNFVENGQYATKSAHIMAATDAVEVLVSGCNFSNSHAYALSSSSINAYIKFQGNHLTGLKSNAAYIQSTTAKALYLGAGGTWIIQDNDFTALQGKPIEIANAANVGAITIKNNVYGAMSYAGPFVSITSMIGGGSLLLDGNVGDNVMPLIAACEFDVQLSKNVNWLGAAATAAGRTYYTLPTFGRFMGTVKVIANPNTGGVYINPAMYAVSRGTDFITGTRKDYVASTTMHNPGPGAAGPLAVQFDLDSVGAGATLGATTYGRNVIISVPSAYGSFSLAVE